MVEFSKAHLYQNFTSSKAQGLLRISPSITLFGDFLSTMGVRNWLKCNLKLTWGYMRLGLFRVPSQKNTHYVSHMSTRILPVTTSSRSLHWVKMSLPYPKTPEHKGPRPSSDLTPASLFHSFIINLCHYSIWLKANITQSLLWYAKHARLLDVVCDVDHSFPVSVSLSRPPDRGPQAQWEQERGWERHAVLQVRGLPLPSLGLEEKGCRDLGGRCLVFLSDV